MLNLIQLRAFVETVDAGTMTAAAERLGVTQSAVSLAIKGLEGAVGAQLLIRARSPGLQLTATGAALVPRARELLALADEVSDTARAAGGTLRGNLTVGCFRTIAPFVLPPLLETFRREHPEVTLAFREGPGPQIEQDLLAGRCEVAILQDFDIGPGLELEPLHELRPHAIVGADHPLAEAGAVELAQLASLPLVLLDVPPSADYLLGLFTTAGLAPQVRHVASSYELTRSLVGRGEGYGLLGSRAAVTASYEGRPLREVEIADDVAPVRFCLATVRGVRPTRRARVFAEHATRLLTAGPR